MERRADKADRKRKKNLGAVLMEWKKLTKESFPPIETSVLLWLDYRKGGFPVVGNVTYTKDIWWWGFSGMSFLRKDEYRRTRWAEIEPPEGELDG